MIHLILLASAIGGYNIPITYATESCDSLIYCQGSLLDTVQRSKIYNDSKIFVDMVQKNPPRITLKKFEALLNETNNNPSKKNIFKFVNENFESQNELVSWTPTDYNENPDFLNKIDNNEVKRFAQALVKLWIKLGRRVCENVFKEPERHSIIPVPNGFIIPGGRFKEIYYWDSYWIIKGLLISGMKQTVKGILDNFISLVVRFGFIPNGSRVYYLNRSQPPLLALMVGLYVDVTNDHKWLEANIDKIEQELKWWLENRTITIEKDGKRYQMAQYYSMSGTPRPESYSEDLETCNSFSKSDQAKCYQNIKSAAESGWDFSSRWFVGINGSISSNITLINTTKLIPVDLNAFLCRAFGELSRFYEIIGNTQKSVEWSEKEKQWIKAINDILYNYEDKIWYDWDIELSTHRKEFFPSNLAPLWSESYDHKYKDQYGENTVAYLESNNILKFHGGIPTSLIHSGQQWDFPNAWPPLQEIVALGLVKTGNKRAVNLSKLIAKRTLTAYMTGFNNTQEMFEKYDAVKVGEFGGGGEYTVQSGFGWTNGVALSLMKFIYEF